MIRPRDAQRSRVYSLDNRLIYAAALADNTTYTDGLTYEDMNDIARAIFDSTAPEITHGGGRAASRANAETVYMLRSQRNTVVLLHELAHTWTLRNYGASAAFHGPEFVGCYRAFLIYMRVLDAATIDRLIKAEGVAVTILHPCATEYYQPQTKGDNE